MSWSRRCCWADLRQYVEQLEEQTNRVIPIDERNLQSLELDCVGFHPVRRGGWWRAGGALAQSPLLGRLPM